MENLLNLLGEINGFADGRRLIAFARNEPPVHRG
jgi:hypothetical protein